MQDWLKVFYNSPLPQTISELESGNILVANDAFYKATEFTKEEVIGNRPDKFGSWHSFEQDVLFPLKKDGCIRQKPIKILTKAGEVRTGIFNAEILEYKGQKVFLSYAIDIQKLTSTEELLSKEKIKSQNYFELSPTLTLILDTDGIVVNINKTGCRILEGDKEDIVGKNWFDNFLPKKISEKLKEGFIQIIEDVDNNENLFPDGFVNDVITINGDTKTIEWYNTTLRDENTGEIKYQYSTGIDITTKVSLEEQVRQSAKLEAVGLLAGGVAHDFNNILTIIGGHAELLNKKILKLEDEEKNDKIKDLCDYAKNKLEKINNAADRAGKLTKQLLAFSRKQIMKPQIINVNEFVVKERDLLRKLIREDIEIILFLEPAIGNVYMDETQLALVFMNLMINSKDAVPGSGKIIIETKNVTFEKISKNKKQMIDVPGDYVMIVIEDDGIGMTKETQERIFEPFFTTKEMGKGVGLGLSTVYGIVKQSNGYIWVYSEFGQGTTFKVYLPRIDKKIETKNHKIIEPINLIGNETILIVEDEKDVRELVCEAVRDLGYKVFSAPNGIEAIEAVRSYDKGIDLLLTDVVMPKMDGRELAIQLSSFLPNLKVLYMSGYTDNTIVHRGILDPGTNFIQKPISTNALAEKIREVLDNGT